MYVAAGMIILLFVLLFWKPAPPRVHRRCETCTYFHSHRATGVAPDIGDCDKGRTSPREPRHPGMTFCWACCGEWEAREAVA